MCVCLFNFRSNENKGLGFQRIFLLIGSHNSIHPVTGVYFVATETPTKAATEGSSQKNKTVQYCPTKAKDFRLYSLECGTEKKTTRFALLFSRGLFKVTTHCFLKKKKNQDANHAHGKYE